MFSCSENTSTNKLQGARYKFGVTVQSKGFDEAPDVILKALHRLIWAKTVTVKASNAFLEKLDPEAIGPKAYLPKANDFNELLALGYMEGDKIRVCGLPKKQGDSILANCLTKYHDDGESELGPVVAALSLGSPCTMKFRPKKSQPFKWLKRRGKHGDEVWQDFLEVTMKHGDIMVMIGEDIQKVYEVSARYLNFNNRYDANMRSTLSNLMECAASPLQLGTLTRAA
jgi:Alkylated DNA repair protein